MSERLKLQAHTDDETVVYHKPKTVDPENMVQDPAAVRALFAKSNAVQKAQVDALGSGEMSDAELRRLISDNLVHEPYDRRITKVVHEVSRRLDAGEMSAEDLEHIEIDPIVGKALGDARGIANMNPESPAFQRASATIGEELHQRKGPVHIPDVPGEFTVPEANVPAPRRKV